MNKYPFDEMQNKKRNEIGNQTLSLMIIMLMLDTLSYNMGFQWIEYPSNIFLIVVICSGVFLIRCVLNGALIAPNQNLKLSTINTIVIMAISMISITLISKFVKPKLPNNIIGQSSEVMTIISGLSVLVILITFVTFFIIQHKDKKLDD